MIVYVASLTNGSALQNGVPRNLLGSGRRFDPATFGGHRLQLGLLSTAVKRGLNLMKVCDQTGHKSLEMLRVYTRDAELFAGNAAAGLL